MLTKWLRRLLIAIASVFALIFLVLAVCYSVAESNARATAAKQVALWRQSNKWLSLEKYSKFAVASLELSYGSTNQNCKQAIANFSGFILSSRPDVLMSSQVVASLIQSQRLSDKVQRTLARNIESVFLASMLSCDYNQQELAEVLINRIYVGSDGSGQPLYGFSEGAKFYFNREPSMISAAQAALLTGITNSPTTFNPRLNPRRALAIRNLMLERMKQSGSLTEAEYNTAIAEPLL